MRYLCLIYNDEEMAPAMDSPEMQALMAEWYEYDSAITERGAKLGGAALQGVSTATTIRKRDGETIVTDGPFAETKEQLGGYYLIEAADLDEAIEIASGIPSLKDGSVEIRPLWEIPDSMV